MATSKGRGGKWCAAPSCNHSDTKGWKMYRFPRNEERCRQWVQNCGRDDLRSKSSHYLSNNCFICMDHFEDSQFWNVAKKEELGLLTTAVPTLFNVLDPPTKTSMNRPLPARNSPPPKQTRKKKKDDEKETVPDTSTSVLPLSSSDDLSASATSTHDSCQDTLKSPMPSSFPCQEPSVLASVDSSGEQEHNATMEGDLFQPSFLHSPAFRLWRQVGEQHGLHTNEDIAGFLIKVYQDMSKMFLSDLTRCRVCRNPVAVTCTLCDWTIHVQKTFGNLPKQSSLTSRADDAETAIKKEKDDSGEGKRILNSEEEERNDGEEEEEDITYCFPFPSVSPLPEEETVTTSEMQAKYMESSGMLEATDKSESTETSQSVKCKQGTEHSDLSEDTAELCPVYFHQATQQKLPHSQTSRTTQSTGSDQPVKKNRLECDECGKTYAKLKYLKQHKLTHGSKKSHVCEVCSKTFYKRANLCAHKKIHEKAFPCDKCSRSFKEEDSLAAHKIHHEKKRVSKSASCRQKKKTDERTLFTCDLCDESFRKESQFLSHRKRHESNPSPISCPWCDKSFILKKQWAEHIKSHKDKKFYVCKLCDQSFRAPSSLRCHMHKHTGQEPYMCEYCGKRFVSGMLLRVHVRIHTGERPYVCEVCEAAFMRKGALRYHRLIHTESVYTCEICGKTFSQERYVKKHKETHSQTDLKVHKCDLCSKAFRWPSELKYHKKAHNRTLGDNTISSSDVRRNPRKRRRPTSSTKVQCNQKRYTCDLCGRSYKSPGELNLHKSFRHFGESPFQCDVCNKKFSSLQTLNRHKWTHTGEKHFMCSTCGKGFTSKSNLSTHQRVHTGEKPYKCTLCNKCYTQSGALKVHMLSHADIKPFECDVCFKAFREKGTMTKHRQSHFRVNSGGF